MLVTKRSGEKQAVNLEKIQQKLDELLFGLDIRYVSSEEIVKRVKEGLYPGVSTFEINNLVSETAASMTTIHPDYSILAGRVCVSALHKSTKDKFSDTVDDLYENYDEYTNDHTPLVSAALHNITKDHRDEIDQAIDYTRDYQFNYFGFKTLEKAYLLCKNGKVVERPQHLIMRVALGIHGDLHSALETYRMMSKKYFTHASPTLFNAGTPTPQMSSCFLVAMREDSIEGIYDTLKDCAMISKRAGGIGLHVHNIRAAGSKIAGNNGRSNGLVPMLRVFNNTARYVDQGGNKRPGAFAVYLEPWHADVFQFLDLRKNHGKEEVRARDLFYALWIPDLFMEKVEKNEDWCLFCPKDAPGLSDVYGDEFVNLYNKYEKSGRARQVIKAQKLWYAILETQTETGTPFILYKDACNRKSNQQNLGTIKSSNLCCEIVQYSSPEEVAVCNLASVALPMFVRTEDSTTWYDFEKLHHVVKTVVRNLNKVIDSNLYPLKEAEVSNRRHRPVAVGVQGLADTFMMLRIPFDSEQARKLNRQIFETIYHAACEASMELSKLHGAYESFPGSPASEGKLQYDLWGVTPSALWNWEDLKKKIATYGLRNSLLVAPMPTASTSQILGFNECFEPFTSNIYSRRVLSGEFQIVNPYMMKDLVELGLWSTNMKHRIIADNGSIQNIDGIPDDIKQLYKTVWEISQRVIIDMAADRGPYIDQSQSMNIHLKDCTFGKLTSMHFYGWKKGLKTGMYYLRTQAASAPIQFTVDQELAAATDKLASATRKRTYLEATGTVNSRVNSNATTEPNSPDEAKKTNGDIFDQTPVRVCTPSMKDNCETCSG